MDASTKVNSSLVIIVCATSLLIAAAFTFNPIAAIALFAIGIFAGSVGLLTWAASIGMFTHWLEEATPSSTESTAASAKISSADA